MCMSRVWPLRAHAPTAFFFPSLRPVIFLGVRVSQPRAFDWLAAPDSEENGIGPLPVNTLSLFPGSSQGAVRGFPGAHSSGSRVPSRLPRLHQPPARTSCPSAHLPTPHLPAALGQPAWPRGRSCSSGPILPIPTHIHLSRPHHTGLDQPDREGGLAKSSPPPPLPPTHPASCPWPAFPVPHHHHQEAHQHGSSSRLSLAHVGGAGSAAGCWPKRSVGTEVRG